MTAWAERLTERSPMVQRSRDRSVQQARVLVDAGRRLAAEKGDNFTTNDLVKEAGVALQTFYRYFSSKDELLLAVLEDMVSEAALLYGTEAAGLDDPLDRLRSHIVSVVDIVSGTDDAQIQFIASQHWRLAGLFPEEIDEVTRPYKDLLQNDIEEADRAGLLDSADPERDAWLTAQFVMAIFHHHSVARQPDPNLADDLWRYFLRALGGSTGD